MVFTGISRASAITKASNSCVKPDPLRHLPGLAALATGDTRDGGMDEGLVLEEPQMLPTAPPRIVNRPVRRAARGALETAARLERDLEVDLLCGRIERHIVNIPRRLQPKRHREKALLRSHAPLISENGPRLTGPSVPANMARRVRRFDGRSLRAERAYRGHNM
jgi:hypothetical protein